MTATDVRKENENDLQGLRVLQRVVLPAPDDSDTAPLFVDFFAASGFDGREVTVKETEAINALANRGARSSGPTPFIRSRCSCS